ncbi:hypothetical protein Ocin01_19168 [Orchesella cincta]|uniref:Uncharacterized protein n=1 Tax=Orchesella cincta TaxID=48709 RepID=A0A1D2M3G8_ORCCI|nr:hypothetical protein Ocin01_19168 [Orchesella cincta]
MRRMMLWHGTKKDRLAGILRDGLSLQRVVVKELMSLEVRCLAQEYILLIVHLKAETTVTIHALVPPDIYSYAMWQLENRLLPHQQTED